MIITSLYTNIAASFKSSYNGRVVAVLTIWHFTKWLGTLPAYAYAISLILQPTCARAAGGHLNASRAARSPHESLPVVAYRLTYPYKIINSNQLHIVKLSKNINFERFPISTERIASLGINN